MTRFSDNDKSGIVYDDVMITVGALASKAAIIAGGKIDSARLNGFRVLKTQYWIDWEGKTDADGPIMIGLSEGLTAAEVASCINADPQSSSELVNNANTKRPVWPLEMLSKQAIEAGASNGQGAFKGDAKIQWSVREGRTLSWWAFNMEAVALAAGTLVNIFAKHFGVWLND